MMMMEGGRRGGAGGGVGAAELLLTRMSMGVHLCSLFSLMHLLQQLEPLARSRSACKHNVSTVIVVALTSKHQHRRSHGRSNRTALRVVPVPHLLRAYQLAAQITCPSLWPRQCVRERLDNAVEAGAAQPCTVEVPVTGLRAA
jgi:hypothetical protein